MISVILTLLLVAVLLLGIIKKYNIIMLLLGISVVTLGIYTMISGISVMGEETVGNRLFDVFELIQQSGAKQLSRNVFIVMTVLGYVSYMEKIKASEMFSRLFAKPLIRLNKPGLVVAGVIIVATFMKLAISSSSSLTAMLLATMYPIMRGAGVSKGTVATSIAIPGAIIFGPADFHLYLTFSLGDIQGITIAEFFAQYQVPLVLIVLAVLAVVIPVSGKYWDKREGVIVEKTDLEKLPDTSELGVPKFYAFLPLMPLVLIIVFSSMIPSTSVISVIAAHFLCLFISMIINIIVKKEVTNVFNETQVFFDGMGKFMGRSGFILVGGTMFSAALSAVGGVQNIANFLIGASNGFAFTLIIACILGFVIAAFSYAMTSLNVLMPLFATVAASTGSSIGIMGLALMTSSGLGMGILPVSTTLIIISSSLDISIPRIIKRNIIPILAALITVILACLLVIPLISG